MKTLSDYLKRDSFIRAAPPPGARRRADLPGRIAGLEPFDLPGLVEHELTPGFALLHARVDEPGDLRVRVVLLGSPWTCGRLPPAHTVICVRVPAAASRAYLGFMARLSRMLLAPDAAAAFESADVDRILEFIHAFER